MKNVLSFSFRPFEKSDFVIDFLDETLLSLLSVGWWVLGFHGLFDKVKLV
jgi:hypothetical protein